MAINIFGSSVTTVQAQDLTIVGATDAVDATARSVPQTTTIAGAVFKQDAIVVLNDVFLDARLLTAGLWYFPTDNPAATVNDLVKIPSAGEVEVLTGVLDSDQFTNVAYNDENRVCEFQGYVKGSSAIVASDNDRFGAAWSFQLNYSHQNQQFEFANVGASLYGLPYAIVVAKTNVAWPLVIPPPVIPAPTITSFTPTSGPIGTQVVVTGTDFTPVTAIFLGGTPVTAYTIDSNTQITFTVPVGAVSTPFLINAPLGSAVSATNFTVTPPVAPVLAALEAAPIEYAEGDPAIPVTNTLTLSSAAPMINAYVSIIGNYNVAEDLLEFTNTANISGAWNVGTGLMLLTGDATVAEYQAAIRAVTYRNTGSPPGTLQRQLIISASNVTQGNVLFRFINVSAAAGTVRQTTVNLPNPVAQSIFDNFYAGEVGINAPDVVPPEVLAVATGSSVSTYDIYLGHNQWFWSNTGGAAWQLWGPGAFSGFVQNIYTFK